MADAETKTFGRVVYVEPTLPQNTGGAKMGEYEDSIPHPYEDYSMAVELTIEKTNRYACGDGRETGEVEKTDYSTTNGTIKFTGAGGKMSFLGGTSGVLTTNYTDISMTNPSNNTNETLGIESIQINYTSWVYPDITIRFVDIRGATVMLPAEQDYYQTGKDNNLGGREISKLYRAFFTFPYPVFTLTVKGFYGMGVRYMLCCDKTTMEMDASTGNFIINAHFIGHMFKVYSEVPMTFLAIAPFLKDGNEYWNKRIEENIFKFKDESGNVTSNFLKIPELKLKLAQVAESQEYLSAAAEREQAEEKFDERISNLTSLIENNPINSLKPSSKVMSAYVLNKDWGYEPITIIKTDKMDAETIKTTMKEFYNSLRAYDETLAEKYKVFNDAFDNDEKLYPVTDNGKISPTTGNTGLFASTYNRLKGHPEYKTFDKFQSSLFDINKFVGSDTKNTVVFIIDGDIFKGDFDFERQLNELNNEKKEKVKELDDRINDMIERALGFRPSIQNMFNLVFAHMDTFTHCFYNHMGKIKSQLDGDRTKRAKTTFNVADEFTDTERRKAEDPDYYGNYLPPFTGFYKKADDNTNKKVLLWPGDGGIKDGNTLEEVKFVKEILSAAEEYADTMMDANRKIESMSSSSTVMESDMAAAGLSYDTDNFIPITPYDFVYKDLGNPYAELKAICRNNTPDLEGKTLLKFILRYIGFVFSQMPSDETHSSYWFSSYEQRCAKLFGEVEALNFARAVGIQKTSSTLNQFIKRYADGNFKTQDSRVFLRMLEGKFDLKDEASNKEAREKYNTIKKSWPLGGANTSDKGILEELPNAKGNDFAIYSLCNKGLRYLPLDVSNTDGLNGKFATGNALARDKGFIPTININDVRPTGDYHKNKPLDAGSFVVLEAGRYVYEIIDKVKALKRDETHPLDYELDLKDDYAKHLFVLPSEDKADDKTYKNEIFRLESNTGEVPSDSEQYKALLNGDAKTKYLIEYPTEINEVKGRSLYAYELDGKKLYDLQKSNEAKAYLFLFSVPLQGYNYGLVNYKSQKVRKENSAKNGSRNRVTLKMRLLREGAFYWRADVMGDLTSKDPIVLPDGWVHPSSDCGFICDGADNQDTLKLKKNGGYEKVNLPLATISRRETLKKMFISWANSTDDTEGFAANEKRLRDIALYEDNDYSKGLNLDIISSSATTGQVTEDMNKLQQFLRNTLCTLCTVVDFYGGNPVYLSEDTNVLYCSVKYIKDAFYYFMDGLRKIYGDWVDKLEDNPIEAAKEKAMEKTQDPFRSKDLRLSIYMTLKSLYDKWLCAPYKGKNTWVLNSNDGNSDFDNFIYMDSYYNKIGLQLTANVSKISQWLDSVLPTSEFYALKDDSVGFYHGISLYEFLTGIAENCGGYLFALPQKVGEVSPEAMMNMFKPLAISDNWVTDSSTFVFLYGYEPSAHLESSNENIDMNGWSREGDGFDLTDEEIIGEIMPDNGDGYKVPAFGVTYAKQNQSYFKNITLNAEDAGVSEVALRATFDIAAQANQNGTRESTLFGQDIYRVYNQYSYTCGVEMMGNMQITPLMYFQLNNVPMWHGAYLIQKVTHDIQAGNITTKITGQRQNKFAIPSSDMGIIVSRKNQPDGGVASGGSSVGGNGNITTINGAKVIGAQNGNSSINTIPIENEDKISETNPVFVFTAAHANVAYKNKNGEIIDKTKENEWSIKIVDTVVSKMKNKGLVAVRGNQNRLGSYDMTDARTIAKKFGSEKVVSIVPHWNGGRGKYFITFFGLDNGNLYNIHQNSPFLAQCMANAAKEVQSRGASGAIKTPKGALSGDISISGDLYRKAGRVMSDTHGIDPALNFNYNFSSSVTPPAVLLEDWFADYVSGVKKPFDECDGEKDSEGRFVSMYDWLRDTEGIETISDMIVRGCLNYLDWLKGGKQDIAGVTVTRSSDCSLGVGTVGEGGGTNDNVIATPTSVKGGGQSFADLVTNENMKKVLSNVSVICRRHDYSNNANWFSVRNSQGSTLPKCPSGMCTYGPSTWYNNAGKDLHFYPSPDTSNHNNIVLGQYGLQMVWHGTIQEALNIPTNKFRPGDVSVQHYYTTNGSASGHGCMWTGKDWRSDFVQSSIMANKNFTDRDGNYSVSIWRHPDFQEPGKSIDWA